MKSYHLHSISVFMRIAMCTLFAVSCTQSEVNDTAAVVDYGIVFNKADSRVSGTQVDSIAVRAFVVEFYDWYVALVNKPRSGPAWFAVLDRQPAVLSDSLMSALTRDRERRSQVSGEIVGIDFDPMLGTQDPCARYTVGNMTASLQGSRIEISCVSGEHVRVDVIAEVERRNGVWLFVEFHYPAVASRLSTILATQ